MLALGNCTKVSTVTSSSDLRFGGQRSKKVKSQTTSNGKTNSANMLAMDRDTKVSTVTSLSDLRFGVKGQKRSNLKQRGNFETTTSKFDTNS